MSSQEQKIRNEENLTKKEGGNEPNHVASKRLGSWETLSILVNHWDELTESDLGMLKVIAYNLNVESKQRNLSVLNSS